MTDTFELLRGALADSHIRLNEGELRDLARRLDRQQQEPTTITVFTELLQELAEYSARVDTGEITHDDFVELQRIEPRIIRGRQDHRYEGEAYRALVGAYHYIKDGARIVLDLDPPAVDQTTEGSRTGGGTSE